MSVSVEIVVPMIENSPQRSKIHNPTRMCRSPRDVLIAGLLRLARDRPRSCFTTGWSPRQAHQQTAQTPRLYNRQSQEQVATFSS